MGLRSQAQLCNYTTEIILFHVIPGNRFSSVTQSCPTLCDPMNCSMPGLPVHHQLPEFTQTHVHQVGDAIQPSHPLSSPFPPGPNPSQHQSFPMSQLFAWGGQSTGVSALASFLPKNTQEWSPLGWTGWISLQSMGVWGVFSNTTVQKHQFFGTQLSSQSNSHIHTWLGYGKTIALTRQTFVGKVMSLLFNMLSRLVITFLPLVITFLPRNKDSSRPNTPYSFSSHSSCLLPKQGAWFHLWSGN